MKGQKKRKVQEVTTTYDTRSRKRMKNDESKLLSKSNALSLPSKEKNMEVLGPQRRTHQDSECSVLSTTDDDDQIEDFAVDNLIKELSDLIRSCGKGEHATKEFAAQKSSKQNISDSKSDESCSSRQQNKRKSRNPKTRKKIEIDGADERKRLHPADKWGENLSAGECSDGEANLTIVEAKRRRRRVSSSDTTNIPDEVMEFIVKSSIDDKLQSIALREKLTETHVKNIIKQVITDKAVLAMLRNSIYGIDFGDPDGAPVYEPKLTRARTKELYEQQMKAVVGDEPSLPSVWGAGGGNVEATQTGTHSLVTEEFPEEEDDEEYHPDLDEQRLSDEESMLSFLGSPSMTPSSTRTHRCTASSSTTVTPRSVSTPLGSLKTIRTAKGERRTVQRTLTFGKEEPSLICSRTRSKYPMTDTPLEYLEMAFKPPDITPDMYETEIDDEDWKKFLLDFSQPQDITKANEDDEQVDPEYNLMADAEEEHPSLDELREELRGDKAVRISKKEVNDLMMEFLDSFNVADDDDDGSGGGDNNSNNNKSKTSISHQLMESNCSDYGGSLQVFDFSTPIILPENTQIFDQAPAGTCVLVQPANQPPEQGLVQEQVEDPEPIVVTFLVPEFSNDQLNILNCQMAQHTQLLTQSILMTAYSEKLQLFESGCKHMLNEMFHAGNISRRGGRSIFHPFNLKFALETLAEYESKREEFGKYREVAKDRRAIRYGNKISNNRPFPPPFPPIIQNIFLESNAFAYIHLLPSGLFHETVLSCRRSYLCSEYYLLASSFADVVSDLNIFAMTSHRQNSPFLLALTKACRTVAKQGSVYTSGAVLNRHLRKLLLQNYMEGEHEDNPLVCFAKTGILELPKARVDPLSKSVPCPLKNIEIRFLPFIFNRMVRKYWKDHPKQTNSTSTQPTDSNQISGQQNSNIIIIQDGSRTQIILPSTYSAIPQNVYLRKQDVTEPAPLSEPPPAVPTSVASTYTLTFPSFAIHRNKPVNTVTPTPITNTISSANVSVPRAATSSCTLPPFAGTSVEGFLNHDLLKPVSLPPPPPSSVSKSFPKSLPPESCLSTKTPSPPLALTQKEDKSEYEFGKKTPKEGSGFIEPPRLPNMTSYICSHVRPQPEVISASCSPSKIPFSLGVTNIPDTPVLHMPFLVNTPCKLPQLPTERAIPGCPASLQGTAETSPPVKVEIEGIPRSFSSFEVHTLMGCSSQSGPAKMNSVRCSPQKGTIENDPLGCSPGRDPGEFEMEECSPQKDPLEVDPVDPLEVDRLKISPESKLQPHLSKKLNQKCEDTFRNLTKHEGDDSVDIEVLSPLSGDISPGTGESLAQGKWKNNSRKNEGVPSLAFPWMKSGRSRSDECQSFASRRTIEKMRAHGKRKKKTRERHPKTKKDSGNKRSLRKEDEGDGRDGGRNVVEEDAPTERDGMEEDCAQPDKDTHSDENGSRRPEGECENVETERNETVESIKAKENEREGQNYPLELRAREDSLTKNEPIEREEREGEGEHSTIEERREWEREDSLLRRVRRKWNEENFLKENGREEEPSVESESGKEEKGLGRRRFSGERESELVEEGEWEDPSTEMKREYQDCSMGNFESVAIVIDDVAEHEGRSTIDNDAGSWVQEVGTEKVERDKKAKREKKNAAEGQGETFEMTFFRKVKENLAKEDPRKFLEFLAILRAFASKQDSAEVIYFEILKILWGFPDLQQEFLILLNPDQAKRVGRYPEYCIMQYVKKLFEASKTRVGYDPVVQAEIIRDLRLTLYCQNIRKDQVLDLLNPVSTLRPDIVRSIMDGLNKEGEPCHCLEENGTMHEDSGEEKSEGSSSSNKSILKGEVSQHSRSYMSEESTPSQHSPDAGEETEEKVTRCKERIVLQDSSPSSGPDQMDSTKADSIKSRSASFPDSLPTAIMTANVTGASRSQRERRKGRTGDCALCYKEPRCSLKENQSDRERKKPKSRSFDFFSASVETRRILVPGNGKNERAKRKAAFRGTVERKLDGDEGKGRIKKEGRKTQCSEGKGGSAGTEREKKTKKTGSPTRRQSTFKATNGRKIDSTGRKKGGSFKMERRRLPNSKKDVKPRGEWEEEETAAAFKADSSKRPLRRGEKRHSAAKVEAVTWTREEDSLLINSVRSEKKLTPSLFKMLTGSLGNKTKVQMKERLNFILKILAHCG